MTWGKITPGKPDPILGIKTEYLSDPSKNKHNLSVGAYNDDDGNQITLRCVKEAEKLLIEEELHKGYLTQCGDQNFCKQAAKLVFNEKLGEENETKEEAEFLKKVLSVQSLSGTGGVRLALEFISRLVIQPSNLENDFETISDKNNRPPYYVAVSNPTWGNHLSLINSQNGVLKVAKYRYYDQSTRSFNLNWMLEDLTKLADSVPKDHPTIVLLHSCAHNPSGCDPSIEEWEKIGEFFKNHKNFIIIFDMAYQGFVTGDLAVDGYPVRLFTKKFGFSKVLVCQSFAKNMGLYGERIGALHIICENEKEKNDIKSNMDFIVRIMYSSPPKHGALIVDKILKTPSLRKMWIEDLNEMVQRIQKMRTELKKYLEELKTPGDWSHIINQRGMFSFTGLTTPQVWELKKTKHIYMTDNGRMSVSGLNTKNVKYIAESINEVIVNPPKL